jgi:hypothetical protein
VPFRQLTYLPDRRSTRIEQSVHMIVRGRDAARVPYQEKVSTLAVNCHGCRFLSRNNVLRGDAATLEVVQAGGEGVRFPAEARVMSVKRLGADEALFDVAVELTSPQDIWEVASPPDDWSEFSSTLAPVEAARELRVVPRADATPPAEAAARRMPLERNRESQPLGSVSRASLPPLLVHLEASLRERIGSELVAGGKVSSNDDEQESLRTLCSQIESEAAKVLERLVANFAEEMTRRARQLSEDHEAAARSTYERWLRKFELEMANAHRRLA